MQLWPRAYRRLRITEIPVRLIYNDPNRYFGGRLDDASFRLAHYRDVLRREIARPLPPADSTMAADELCACCHCD